MEHQGHRARMRQRYRAQGLDGFAEHEILELLLFYAIPQRNVNPLAHALIDHFGSLDKVLAASPEALMRIDGMGEYAATLLSLFPQVVKRCEKTALGEKISLSTRKIAEDYCIRLLKGEKREKFYCICLNAQMEVIADALVATGSLSEVPSYPRVVAEKVLVHGAHSVLLCHNHPGGSIIPSQSDMTATRELSQMLRGLEVVLCDHIIVGGDQALSMVRHHLIEQEIMQGSVYTKVADPQGEILIKAALAKEMRKSEENKEK